MKAFYTILLLIVSNIFMGGVIFTVFTTVLFKGKTLHWNHFAAFVCLVLAVYFVFYK